MSKNSIAIICKHFSCSMSYLNISLNNCIFRSIYHLIKDRENLWNKMIMMQEQANDPARLWQNRGGQLLKEEKERKVIQKVIHNIFIMRILQDRYKCNIFIF